MLFLRLLRSSLVLLRLSDPEEVEQGEDDLDEEVVLWQARDPGLAVADLDGDLRRILALVVQVPLVPGSGTLVGRLQKE